MIVFLVSSFIFCMLLVGLLSLRVRYVQKVMEAKFSQAFKYDFPGLITLYLFLSCFLFGSVTSFAVGNNKFKIVEKYVDVQDVKKFTKVEVVDSLKKVRVKQVSYEYCKSVYYFSLPNVVVSNILQVPPKK